jgi:predicted adenylyl cyclase CyaB
MKNIEIEARSFITASQYKNLEAKLNKIAKFLGGINEETVYCGEERMRIRRDDDYSWLILKSGKIHDDFRNEIKIQFKRSDFEKLKEMFKKLGFNIDVVWFRKRKVYNWRGTKVFLDDTKGYGKIIELEKIGRFGKEEVIHIHRELENKLKSLGIKITPKKVFEEKFKYYKNNWRKILKLKN